MSLPSTIYRGHELFTMRVNRREAPDITAAVAQQAIDSSTGAVALLRPTASHVHTKPLLYFLQGRADVTTFVLWAARRMGRRYACWVPSAHNDLELVTDIGAADTTFDILASDYTDTLFPFESRRHLAFIAPDASVIARRVEGAVDNGDGTETLTLESSLGVDFPKYGTLVSFLALCRLESDAVTVQFHHPVNIAEARVRFTELPRQMEWAGEFPAEPE